MCVCDAKPQLLGLLILIDALIIKFCARKKYITIDNLFGYQAYTIYYTPMQVVFLTLMYSMNAEVTLHMFIKNTNQISAVVHGNIVAADWGMAERIRSSPQKQAIEEAWVQTPSQYTKWITLAVAPLARVVNRCLEG